MSENLVIFTLAKTMYLYISNFYDTIKYFLKDMTFKCFIYTNNIANINKSDALKYELFCYDLKCFLYFILYFCQQLCVDKRGSQSKYCFPKVIYIILLEMNSHIKVVIIYLNIDYERQLAYIQAECSIHDGLFTKKKVFLLKLT